MLHYNRYTNIIGNFEDYERTINVFKNMKILILLTVTNFSMRLIIPIEF